MRYFNFLPLLMAMFVCQFASAQKHTIVPAPSHFELAEGKGFLFTEETKWVLPQANEKEFALALAPLFEAFEQAASFAYETQHKKAKSNAVQVLIDQTLASEEYHLSATNDKIIITVATPKGLFYATQSMRQLLPAKIESLEKATAVTWQIPAVQIKDKPTLAYRGLMLDVARFFLPKENLLKIIDVAGLLKINTLHLHLVDDTGFRIEIKKYPKLTEVGAWSVEREEFFSARKGPLKGEPTPVGGFYTQEDIKEIVAYAASRSIEVIPEIEMPAHTVSSLAAYPEMACDTDKFIGVLPGFAGVDGFTPVYCAGKEEVFTFIENILTEVITLFPTDKIHIGGDEAPTIYWEQCKHCQARMKAEGITNVHHLQSYFMKRIDAFLKAKNKQLYGWDELTDSPMPKDAVIVGWRGDGHAAFKAGKLGHKYILAPAKTFYFIRYQGPQWYEPRTYFGNNTLKNVYSYQPIPEGTAPEVAALMMGTQACLWSEFVTSPQDAEYLLFPRLLAYAENAWTPATERNWDDFLPRLDAVVTHLDELGVASARSMFNLDHKVTTENGKLKVALSNERTDIEIRYTTRNTVPTAYDPLYTTPIEVTKTTLVSAAAFKDGKQVGHILQLPLKFNKATAAKITAQNASSSADLLINGLRGSDKYSDFEWTGWYAKDGSFVVDLGSTQHIERVALGTIIDEVMSIGRPKKVTLSGSVDGTNYTLIEERNHSEAYTFEETIEVEDMCFEKLNTNLRYLKVTFENPGKIPTDRPRNGQDSWVYFDEIIIE